MRATRTVSFNTLEGAKVLAAAGEAEALKRGWAVAMLVAAAATAAFA
jgi:hypothetical protein